MKKTGPFGNYPWGTPGAVLNTLVCMEQVPVTTVERFQVAHEELQENEKVIARFKWFEGLEHPLFYWVSPDYKTFNQQRFILTEEQKQKPDFRLQLSVHLTPCFQITGNEANTRLYEFLHGMLTNFTDDPRYRLSKDAHAFFQGGANAPKGEWFLIEFWRPEGAQAWIDYVNQHYGDYEELGLYQ